MRYTTNVTQLSFNSNNFPQELVLDRAFDTESESKSQADIERKTLEIAIGVERAPISSDITKQFLESSGNLKVDERELALHGASVESCGSGFPSPLDRVVPGRSPQCEDAL